MSFSSKCGSRFSAFFFARVLERETLRAPFGRVNET